MSNGRIYPIPNEGEAPIRFGLDAEQIRTLRLDLAVARDKVEIKIGGNFLWAFSATDNAANANVAFRQDNADEGIAYKNGSSIAGVNFDSIFVTNAAQAGKFISFLYAVEDPRLGGLRIDNPAGDFSSLTTVSPGQSNSAVDSSLAVNTEETIAANSTRTRLWVEADINNAENLRVGPVVSDTQGLLLSPGAAVEIFTTEAVVVRNSSTNAAANTYRYLEEYI